MVHLGVALIAGGLIGLERSYHGRPAGFRTHVLVCISSALLMLVTLYQEHWFPATAALKITSDPTRMAQGIMTGIGFLGAGVIMKDGFSVRGLTTAASIWITAAIGVLSGIGFYEPVVLGTLMTLAALAVFRWLEAIMPCYVYAQHRVSFDVAKLPSEAVLRQRIADLGFSISSLSYQFNRAKNSFEYRMNVRSKDPSRLNALAVSWQNLEGVLDFEITPA